MTIQLAKLSTRGVIHVSGRDAKTFLQGQLTCDMNVIAGVQTRLGAYCNRQGRMHAIMRVYGLHQENYLLRLEKSVLSHVLKTFKQFSIFSKVEIKDVSDEWHVLGINVDQDSLSDHTEDGFFITRLPGIKQRYEILYQDEPKEAIQRLLTEAASMPEDQWLCDDIASGIAWITDKTIELFTPHQVNLHCVEGISFTKGCYVGQEIVARMHHLGKLKQHGYYAVAKSSRHGEAASIPFFKGGEIEPGDSITLKDNPEKIAGNVVNAVCLDDTYHLLLSLQDALRGNPLGIAQLPELLLEMRALPYTC
ncbi:MAG: ygfZ [Gammaproteobacteria bacterium]|jgi:folate-binding protein YgfZ|nr:ygfZ [Gammaproteobacteria bacterium]